MITPMARTVAAGTITTIMAEAAKRLSETSLEEAPSSPVSPSPLGGGGRVPLGTDSPDSGGVVSPSLTLPRKGKGDALSEEESVGDGTTTSLLPLFAWLSPSFPVGAYAYSHALEWAVEAGDVEGEGGLLAWLKDLLLHGFARSDAILLARAFDAAAKDDAAELAEVNALAVALAPSAELRLETGQQGRSFLEAVLAAWPNERLQALAPALKGEVAYPIALGLAAATHGLPKEPVVEAFLLALMQALVSAGIRLAPVGQTGGMRVLAALAPDVQALAVEIPSLTLDDLGTATFRADLGSFRHETQYTRLFRS